MMENWLKLQSNFIKSAMYVLLSTYYKCTNLQVVQTCVQLRMNMVIARNHFVSSSRNELEMSNIGICTELTIFC